MAESLSSGTVSTKLERIAKLAKQMPNVPLSTLAHHIDIDWLHEAYRRTRKDSAAGVDGQTAAEYQANLGENLKSLLDRAKSGDRYRAPPVRRVHIPKGDGKKTRPIGIPTLEDKLLQRAVAMVLEAVYEQDFLDCSYGFRPGRSPHQAVRAVWKQAMDMGGCWVLEVDIEDFFGSLDKKQLREILSQRVRDGVLLRLIGKWLKAGVMEDGCLYHPETGVPQGGVISPLLSNVYLHEVLDQWFESQVKPRLKGRAFLTRFADDFVLTFQREEDALRVQAVLAKRFGKYGLRLHPEKTRLVRFTAPSSSTPSGGEGQRQRSFDLLGFTLYWGRSRKGRWVVRQKTMKSRLRRALRRSSTWCKENRHLPVREQSKVLSQKLRGHYSYYGVTGNFRALMRLYDRVQRIWHKWLGRRSNRPFPWDRMVVILEAFPLPRPRVVHSVYLRVAKP
ncbi:group II intron reverse transcriptase/maturase [Myxococcota bacterium]